MKSMNLFQSLFDKTIEDHKRALYEVNSLKDSILEAGEIILRALAEKRSIFSAGNGGSASDAQHFSAELVGRFVKERSPYKSICLNTDTSAITAISNDYGFDSLFERQLKGLAQKGDVFIAISTSGNSENLLRACAFAKENGLIVIGILGRNGGQIAGLCHFPIIVSSDSTARIQEMHILILHLFCEIIDDSNI